MIGTWNALIKTTNLNFQTVFTIREDEKGTYSLNMETEPFYMDLEFKDVHVEGNLLKATGSNPSGQPHELELVFSEHTFSGMLTSPHFGPSAFTGEKGRGAAIADQLRKYGEKSVQENHYWKGKWIWDVKQPEPTASSEHRLVYFRRTFQVPEGVKPKLTVDITADSRYRLYVNGKSIVVGPCKGDAHVQYYETVDVSEYLQIGTNVLAVKVLHYAASVPFKLGEGGPISIWRSQSGGLFVEASLRDENDLELESLHSGSRWRSLRHRGYSNVPKTLIQWMGGVEEVDGAGAPQGWEAVNYDDCEWTAAVPFADTRNFYGLLSPWNLVPRPIPFMYEEERTFKLVTKAEGIEQLQAENWLRGGTVGNDTTPIYVQAGQSLVLEMDAGELTTGYLTVGLCGGQGSVVRIMGSECYEAQESNERQRKKGNREDTSGKLMGEFDVYRIAGNAGGDQKAEVYEPFWFRTFRYVRLEIETAEEPLTLLYTTYRETGYPLEVTAEFQSSDDELNTIWDLSVRTLKRCMHETYEDCPFYEQLQYAMDSRLMMLYTYHLSADDRMPRRTITDFYHSRQPSGMLQARYPSVEPQVIPSFSLYWVDMLAEHYEHVGDAELIVKYRPAMIELMNWFDERLTDDGIVGITSNRFWTYFDWVDAWPMGAPSESAERPMFLLSLMYAASLRKLAKLLAVTGWKETASDMESRADDVCRAVKQLAWSGSRQLFRDLPDTEIYSQHTQVMAVLAGAVSGEEAKQLMERTLSEQLHRVTLPFSYLLFQAVKQTGLHDQAFDLWDRWRIFALQGLTTLPEVENNPRSDCHAWSAVPLVEFPTTILGVTPAEPGYKAIHIAPKIGKLKWARGRVATIQGMVDVDWVREENELKVKVKAPDGIPVVLQLPDGTEHIFQGEGQFTSKLNTGLH